MRFEVVSKPGPEPFLVLNLNRRTPRVRETADLDCFEVAPAPVTEGVGEGPGEGQK